LATSDEKTKRGSHKPICARLTELRKSLVRSTAASFAGVRAAAVDGWVAANSVMATLRGSVTAIAFGQHRNAALKFAGVAGAFDLEMRIRLPRWRG